MATVTGFTAPRMLEIENNTVVSGTVDENGHLKLVTHGGEIIDAGKVKGDKGEQGNVGPAGPVTSPNPEPIAPSALSVLSNTAYHSPAGQPISAVVFQWNPVLLDIIGDVPAIDMYELWYRETSSSASILLASSETTTATVDSMAPGVNYRVKIRAHTFQGEWGAYSAEIPVIPAIPSNSVPDNPGDATIITNVPKYTADGGAVAILNFTWDEVTLSTDSDPIGIQTYEVWLVVDGAASPVLQTPENSVFLSFPSGSLVELKVKAMSNFGIWGDFSESDIVTAAFPAPNNNPTTVPVLTTNMGVVYSSWNGNLSTGPAGPEFQHLITEVGTSATGPWAAIGIPAVSAGQTAVIPSSPGANVWVRFRWRDKLGRLSSGISPVASITTLGIEQSDFTPDLSDVITNLEAAVISVVTEYSVNASETVPPVSGWSTATPARTPGTFVWMRTTTNYADSTSSTSSPVLVTGNTGGTGTAGKGISSTAVTYQVHSNGTTAPTGTWVASPPATTTGQFLWTRTITTYTDATNSTAYSVAAHGATGAAGTNGATGAAGVGVSGTAVTYQVHTNGTVAPTGTWLASPAATAPGQFLWTRTVTTYTNASTSTAYSVAAHGATGSQGIQGPVGPNGATTYTWIKYSDTPTTGMSDLPDGKIYMGIAYNKLTATESSVYADYAWSLIQGPEGDQGSQGIQGPAGADGETTYTWIKYADTPTTGMSDLPAGKIYMGIAYNKLTATESSNYADYAWSLIQGPQGTTGAAGKGIASTVVAYQVHTNGTTAPTGTWVSTPPATTTGQFLWTRTTITYTDASTVPVYSVSAHGATGATGSTGNTGAAGTDATNVVVGNDAVAIPTNTSGATTSTHAITIPFSGWIGNARAAATIAATGLPTGITSGTNTAATASADGSLILNVANGSTLGGGSFGEITLTITCNGKAFVRKFSWSKAVQGSTGSTGSTGGTGPAGKGVSSTVVDYQASTSGTVAPTGTWVSTPPAVTPGQYLWTRTVITYTDATNTTGYSIALQGATGATGSTGSTGPAGKGISTTVVTYQADASGTVVPSGTWVSSPPATTPGQYLWTRTVITYTDATSTTAYAISKHGDTGATGTTGSAGAPATAIDVGNEAVVIPCTSAGATVASSTITIPFTGYVGNARAAATVAVSGLPTGITVSTNTAGTSGAAGSLVLAVASGSTLGGTNNGNITLTITCNSLTFVQTFSWSKAIAGTTGSTGSTGSTGAAGVDATNVIVGNDAVAIPTDPAGATATSYAFTVPFSGWIGNARAAATIAATGLPTGITAGTNTAATVSADGSLILNVASGSTIGGATYGEITLTVTCNGKAFPHKFTWTKAPQGATGATGSTGGTGSAGVSATSIDVGNEAVVIPCTSAGATTGASTITIPFTGFIGATRAATTVAVSGLPTGITVQTNTAGTSGAAGSLVLAVASASTLGGAASGNITLTITCNSIVFVQLFSWTKGVAGAAGSTGGTGPAGKGVSSVTPYYLQQGTGVAAPAAPTTNPPGGSWSITEPGYVSSTELYRAELFVFTDATFGWTSVSKVSAYTAATQAMTAANLADAAAHGMVKASQTDPGQSAGRIWLVLNASNQVIGVKISNGSAWTSYVLMADQILVPSSVGTVSIADGAVNASKVNATSIWADEGWLNVLRVGVIEASMVTSDFESELTLESNNAINVIVTQQEELATNLDTVQEDLETTSETLTGLSDELGTVSGIADNAMTAAEAADTLAKQNQIALNETQLWFRVDGSGAHVGRTDSAFQTHIFPGKLSITDNGVETTWWEANRMVVPTLEATSQIVIARHQLEPFPSVNPTGTVIRSVS